MELPFSIVSIRPHQPPIGQERDYIDLDATESAPPRSRGAWLAPGPGTEGAAQRWYVESSPKKTVIKVAAGSEAKPSTSAYSYPHHEDRPWAAAVPTSATRFDALLAERDSMLRQLESWDEKCDALTQQLGTLSGKTRGEIDEIMSTGALVGGTQARIARADARAEALQLTTMVTELTGALEMSKATEQQLAEQVMLLESAAGDSGHREELRRAARADEVACLTEQVAAARGSYAAQAEQVAALLQTTRCQAAQLEKIRSLLWGMDGGTTCSSTATGTTLDVDLLADAMSTAACDHVKAVGIVAAYRSAADPAVPKQPTGVAVLDSDGGARPGRGTMDEIRKTLAMLKDPGPATATTATTATTDDETSNVCLKCTDVAQQLDAASRELARLVRTCELQRVQIDCQTRHIDAESREQWREISSLKTRVMQQTGSGISVGAGEQHTLSPRHEVNHEPMAPDADEFSTLADVLLLQSEVAASEHEGSELTAVKSQVLQMLLKLGIAPARGEHRLAGRWRHVQADLQSIGSVVDKRLAELERTGETFAALQCDARQHRDDSAKLHELVLSACSGVMTGAGTATGSGSPLIDKLSNLSKSYVDVVEQNEKLRAEIQSGGLVVGAGAPADGQKAPLPEGWELAVEPGSDYVYFVDHSTQSTSWVDPRTGRAQQSTQQPQARKQMEDKIRALETVVARLTADSKDAEEEGKKGMFSWWL